MNWPAGRKGQVFAGTYVVAFVAMVVGIAWTLYNQATSGTGSQVIIGACLFLAGQLLITLLAFGLRARAPLGQGKSRPSGYQLLWHRLSLGRELPSAVRALRAS
ncbi:hypothetical protein [Kribbella sp. NPDC051620]|uniref:hypothetical protein n=1 Tax=Kribbella sp. NPDC051620 TaxID=3364120 RepID=UPI0037941794